MNSTTRKLAETAVMLALATVLSFVKIDMPMGGGMTICSMLPLVIVSCRYGWKWGVFSAFVYSVLQMLFGLDNVQYATSTIMAVGIIALDYIVAYTVIGFAGAFSKSAKNPCLAVIIGIVVTFFGRFICHFITGVWIWDALWPNEYGMASALYSLLYNGWYMLGETVLTCLVTWAIYKPLGKYFRGEDLKA